jgi:antitoxin component YwqK of YwqJK toxin-antitoxin module
MLLNEFNSKEYHVLKNIFENIDAPKDLAVLVENYVYAYIKLETTYTDPVTTCQHRYLVSEFPIRFTERFGMCTEYHPNGNIKGRIPFVSGKKHGTAKFYDSFGSLQASIEYNMDKLHGMYLQWSYNGQLVKQYEYRDGVRHGLCKEWTERSLANERVIIVESEYHYGELHGDHREWFENGDMKLIAKYIHGKPEGEHKEYTRRVVETIEKSTPGVISTKRHTVHGLLSVKNYSAGVQHGVQQEFYSNGKLSKETVIDNGKQSVSKEYNTEGILVTCQNYSPDGKLHGQLLKWNNDGLLTHSFNYNQGQPHGVCITKNTQTTSGLDRSETRQLYQDGLLHGTTTRVCICGTTIETTEYAHGKRHGEHMSTFHCTINSQTAECNHPHNLYEKSNWKHGKLSGKRILYFSNGQVKSETVYIRGARNGPSVEYWEPTADREPVVKFKTGYKNDGLDGEVIEYWPNGQLKRIRNYNCGNPVGEYTMWTNKGQISEQGVWIKGKKNVLYSLAEEYKSKKHVVT